MPLRAKINGKEIISTYLSKDEWKDLKYNIKINQLDVLISQTNKQGYLRTSKLGLQHFAHKKGEKPENWKPESRQHMLAKTEILLACKEVGWEAKSEYIENNWIADVLAIKGNIRIAFEVQWSRQSYDKTIERQTNYKNDNVRGCWFFKTPPKQILDYENYIIAEKELPIFKIYETETNEIWVDQYGKKFPIRDLVISLLNRNMKFCKNLVSKIVQKIEIFFPTIECWKCKTRQHVYVIQDTLISKCGQPIEIHDTDWNNNSLKHNHQIHEAVSNFMKTEKGKFIRIGEIKERYSHTIKSSYMSFGCLKCDSLFGDFHMPNVYIYKIQHKRCFSIFANIKIHSIKEEKTHWCFSKIQDFCE